MKSGAIFRKTDKLVDAKRRWDVKKKEFKSRTT